MSERLPLNKFIEAYIFKNTLIRLWKPEDISKPDGVKVCLTRNPIMEWEAEGILLLRNIPVIGVTDIVCDADNSAVNIVLYTLVTPEEVSKAIDDYWGKKEKERGYLSDGC